MSNVIFFRRMVTVATSALLVATSGFAAADTTGMVEPQYDESGNLIRPTDYAEWVFVGASLGLSYFGEEKPVSEQVFHHVYMQPEAFRHYAETGTFAEKTMFVMENYSAGTKQNNTAKGRVEGSEEFKILHGQFEDARVGLEVALKDSERFEERWAYFNFTNFGRPLKENAKAFPKAVCWDCHDRHAADDNVFIQYYPVLRRFYEERLDAGEIGKPESRVPTKSGEGSGGK